jgi:tetratricopeptide (TPR) repeat protein
LSADTDAPLVPAADALDGADPVLEARIVKAQALQDARDWAGLAQFTRDWARQQPDRNEPFQYMGVAYSGLGDYKLAVEPLQKVFARDPDNAQARSLLADAYLQSQRWTEASAMYKQMVTVTPDDARLWNNYGAALNASGQQAQAVAALETAVRLDPGFKQAWTNLGQLYQSMGDATRASAALARGQ